MKINKRKKEIIHEALKTKADSFQNSVMHLAKDGIITGPILKKLKKDVIYLRSLVIKWDPKNPSRP